MSSVIPGGKIRTYTVKSNYRTRTRRSRYHVIDLKSNKLYWSGERIHRKQRGDKVKYKHRESSNVGKEILFSLWDDVRHDMPDDPAEPDGVAMYRDELRDLAETLPH